MAQLTTAAEEYLNSFPKGTRFRIVDFAGRYWNNEMLAWSFVPDLASAIPAEDIMDKLMLAARNSNVDPMKIFMEAVPAPTSAIRKSLLLNSARH
jgi:hypothetical protein